jgi:superfamily II DNA or RNA helicase
MSSQLRDFQIELKRAVRAAWTQGAKNVMMVTATGGGKTVTFCNIVAEETTPCVLISHRQELVAQAALSLNREGVPHGIIAPAAIQRQIVTLEQELFGRSFYSPRADVRVAGVDTLIRLDPNSDPWLKRVGLVVQDEGHHVLADNKWGQAQAMFPGARGLLVTAHAHRADGKGLGRHADGIVDALVVGPSGRNLIDRGFLCDYRLIVPPSDVHLTDDDISAATGDYKQDRAREAVHRSKTIVGDVVKHYLKFAAGKLGITFAVDIQSATEIAAKYRSAGVPAEIITAKTPLHERGQLMRFFRSRRLLQLVSVDVLGEGVDVPAVEVVSMARPTASFQLFAQQFGRALRLMLTDEQNRTWNDRTDAQRLAEIAASVKPKALIIDHVENYAHHGLPDVDRTYSLDRRGPRKRARKDDIPLRQCLNTECYAAYPAAMNACPECGLPKPAPAARGTPAEVDGNCEELDPAVLERMRAEQARIDGPAPLAGNDIVGRSIQKQHRLRQDAQADLRATMATWAGWQKHQGKETAAEVQRTFYFKFGIDVMSAQILGASDAAELRARIDAELSANRVEGAA